MSDEKSPIPPETETIDAEPVPAEAPPEASEPPRAAQRRRRQPTLVPWVYALALVVLAGAVAFLWWHPVGTQSQSAEVERMAALDQRVQALGAEVQQLAARPAGQPQELAALRTQLAELDKRPAGQPQELAALQAQVAALTARPSVAPDIARLEHRVDALEQRKPPPVPDLAPIQQKIASLEQQVGALSRASQAAAQSGADQAAALAAQRQQIQERLTAQGQQVQNALKQAQDQLTTVSQQAQEQVTAQNQQVQNALKQVQDQLTTVSQQAQERLTTLDQQVQARAATTAQQIAALSGRIDGFGTLRDDIGRIDQKLDRLAREQQGDSERVQSLATAQKNAEGDLTNRVASNATAIQDLRSTVHQLDSSTTARKNAEDELTKRIGSNETAIQELRGTVHQLDAGLNRAATATQAQAALAALAAGRPVGTIAGAPPAVARYATEPPPTLAELRRSFDAVAAQAQAASQPVNQGNDFLDRVWTRAQGLVTVRQGDHVIVGDPAAGVIARARDDLDVGDLAGAVAAVSKLTGPAAQAMAGWLQSARSLLAARTALIGMAGQG